MVRLSRFARNVGVTGVPVRFKNDGSTRDLVVVVVRGPRKSLRQSPEPRSLSCRRETVLEVK